MVGVPVREESGSYSSKLPHGEAVTQNLGDANRALQKGPKLAMGVRLHMRLFQMSRCDLA